MMRAATMIVGLCLAPAAIAASQPPATVMMGTVATANVAGLGGHRCGTNAGQAFFQRDLVLAGTPPRPAVISLPAVFWSGGAGGASYTGALSLKFSGATSGTAAFDYDQSAINTALPSGSTAPFVKYSQVWAADAATLKVTLSIQFPKCTLPIVAFFHALP